MSRNKICGISAFVEPMRVNESMRILNLGWNALNDDDALALVQIIKHSRSLAELTLKGNPFSSPAVAALDAAALANKNLSNYVAAIPVDPQQTDQAPPSVVAIEGGAASPVEADGAAAEIATRPVSATQALTGDAPISESVPVSSRSLDAFVLGAQVRLLLI